MLLDGLNTDTQRMANLAVTESQCNVTRDVLFGGLIMDIGFGLRFMMMLLVVQCSTQVESQCNFH